jgi:hypothetical protein
MIGNTKDNRGDLLHGITDVPLSVVAGEAQCCLVAKRGCATQGCARGGNQRHWPRLQVVAVGGEMPGWVGS